MSVACDVVTVLPVVARDGDRAEVEEILGAHEEFDVMPTASTEDEAVAMAATLRPDVIVVDVALGGADGIAATRAILATDPSATVVFWTSAADEDLVRAALDAGAAGYLLKDSDDDALADGVKAAARGGCPLHPKAARIALRTRASARPVRALSDRERDVLALVARGLANKQIASRLGIAERTVKAHMTNIFMSLGVRDRTNAALWARSHLSRR